MPNFAKLLTASALTLSLCACQTLFPTNSSSGSGSGTGTSGNGTNPTVAAKVSVMSNNNGVLTYQTKDQTFSIQENKDGSFGIILDNKVHNATASHNAQKYDQSGTNGEIIAFSLEDLIKHKSSTAFETQYANMIVARKQIADNQYEYVMAPYGTKSKAHGSATATHNGHVVFNSKLFSNITLNIDFDKQTVAGQLGSFKEVTHASNVYDKTATTSYAAGNSSKINFLAGTLFLADGKVDKDYNLSAKVSGMVNGVNYTGDLDGAFYGPKAEESAGVVTLEQIGSGNKQIGGFLAK